MKKLTSLEELRGRTIRMATVTPNGGMAIICDNGDWMVRWAVRDWDRVFIETDSTPLDDIEHLTRYVEPGALLREGFITEQQYEHLRKIHKHHARAAKTAEINRLLAELNELR